MKSSVSIDDDRNAGGADEDLEDEEVDGGGFLAL